MPKEPLKRPSKTCDIYRNGRLYDALNPTTHEVEQICRSYALDMPQDTWELYTISGTLAARYSPEVKS